MNGSEAIYPERGYPVDIDEQPEQTRLIQPHGMLLVASRADLRILQVSANSLDHLNISSQNWLDESLSSLINQPWLNLIQQLPSQRYFRPFRVFLPAATAPAQSHQQSGGHSEWRSEWDASAFCSQDLLFIELEPVQSPNVQLGQTAEQGLAGNPYLQLHSAMQTLQQVSSLDHFLQAAATEIRNLTGFDRVMVYQFDSEGAGTVIAEAKRQDLFPYLGLHYPASDIPNAPRQLYAKGLLRYIPDLGAAGVELIPPINPLTQTAVDLSFVSLRGVDPCCLEYHQNMGVAAMMVIALVRDQQLWGLIACHHHTPRQIPLTVRTTCELLGQFVAAELVNKVNDAELDDLVRLKAMQSEFVTSIANAEDLKTVLVHPAPRILDLVGAEGAAVCLEDEITLIGKTPPLEAIPPLLSWAEQQGSEALFSTNSLPKLYPAVMDYKDVASGLLLLRISQVRRYSILWFRPEVLQTVNWAGDPHASLQLDATGQLTLSPRQSFARWQETVQFTSLPWKQSELENALDLRNAIVGIVLNKADELIQMNRALERSNRELESFAYAASHDLKEPLRGIHNYATFLVEDYAELLDEAGIDRLHTLVRLTQRMETLIDVLLKFSQLGQTEVNRQPTDLNELLQQVVNVFRISQPEAAIEVRVPRPLPIVQVDPTLINEVFSNLLSNAHKYNDKAQPWLEIGYLDPDDPSRQQLGQPLIDRLQLSSQASLPTVFYVRDNGIGIRERHLETIFRLFKRLHPQTMYGGGTGAGLTIAKKIIERHNGQIWVQSTYGEGSTFYLTLE